MSNNDESIHPSITEVGFYHKLSTISRLLPTHPEYGICPNCGSNNTLPRELQPDRVCLTCGHLQSFDTFEESKTAWKPQATTPTEDERLVATTENHSPLKTTVRPHPPLS